MIALDSHNTFVELLLKKGAVKKVMEAGEVLYQENSPPNYYYQLLSGRVRISSFYDDGKEVLHKIVCRNEGFGGVSILNDHLNNETAITDSPCTLLKIGAERFLEILHENQPILAFITLQFAKDIRFNIFINKLICSHYPKNIITNLLQFLHEDRRLICQKCNRLMLTRQQLANMTGLRVETIIRTMKLMEKNDELNIIKGKVFIPCEGKEEE